jgi:hypothetical protein
MVVTEQKAKISWCPFVRQTKGSAANGMASGNRGPDDTNCCLPNECMAWQQYGETKGYCKLIHKEP